ncbi:hypothetical protein J5893_02130 [bacterium]|nr:hypothetical protein [bacterium]
MGNTRFIPFPGLNGGASINMITGDNSIFRRMEKKVTRQMENDQIANLKGSGLEGLFKDEIKKLDDSVITKFDADTFINGDYKDIKDRPYTIEYGNP